VEELGPEVLTSIPSSDMTVSWLESFYVKVNIGIHMGDVLHVLRYPGHPIWTSSMQSIIPHDFILNKKQQ
jgi:hypothetical protein